VGAAEAQIDCALNHLEGPPNAEAGVTMMIEPLNPTDFPPASCATPRRRSIWSPGSAPQCPSAVRCLPRSDERRKPDPHDHFVPSWIGHIQIADVPGRHQPGTGEINFPTFSPRWSAEMQRLLGLEYRRWGQQKISQWLPARPGKELTGLNREPPSYTTKIKKSELLASLPPEWPEICCLRSASG
jgi:hypothetical protein